jgi:hypothetical protein
MTNSIEKDKASESSSSTTSTTINTIVPNRTIKTFDGSNYSVWAKCMRNVLTERDIDKYLDKRETISNYNEREERQALFEIQFVLADTQMKQVINCQMAYDTWEKLKTIYQHTDKSNLLFLKLQFLGLKMKDGERIHEFVRRIDEMADKIACMSEEPSNDEEKAIILTRGVSAKYHMTVIVIMQTG